MNLLELVLAVLTLFPHTPARQCILDRRDRIVQVLEDSRQRFPEMPSEMLVAVGFMETHLGCDRNEGRNWGAPIDRNHRHTAGTPMQAAASLWTSYERCGTWEGAARRFRTGLCRSTPVGDNYSRNATRIAERLRLEIQRNRENSANVCRLDSRLAICAGC